MAAVASNEYFGTSLFLGGSMSEEFSSLYEAIELLGYWCEEEKSKDLALASLFV